jgi:hypothetical protein
MHLPNDAQRSWSSGAASLELALLAPVLILLLVATWDFGRAIQESSRLAAAARAGAQYGMQSVDTAADTAAIAQAVRDDAQDPANALTVQCLGGGAVACDGTCGRLAPPRSSWSGDGAVRRCSPSVVQTRCRSAAPSCAQ